MTSAHKWLVLKRPMTLSKYLDSEGVSEEQCRDAIAEAFPVIELHHYVLPKFCPAGPWMIASNGLHAGLVLPAHDGHCPGLVDGARSIRIRIDGVLIGSAEDDASLARPVTSLKWLASRLTPLGLRLRRGQLIRVHSHYAHPYFPVFCGLYRGRCGAFSF